jgi:hypothetical protein
MEFISISVEFCGIIGYPTLQIPIARADVYKREYEKENHDS